MSASFPALLGKVAVVTGASSGIGAAIALELAKYTRGLGLVDKVPLSAEAYRALYRCRPPDDNSVRIFVGDAADNDFRREVFDKMVGTFGPPNICVPAAGITRDRLAVKIDKDSGKADIYPEADLDLVYQVNYKAPLYWGLEMVARMTEARAANKLGKWTPEEGVQGKVLFIGSTCSRGNKGQVSYGPLKAALAAAAETLTKEALFYGIVFRTIHPGFTDTPMVRKLGEQYIKDKVLPQTQLGRLMRPEEIAEAAMFLLANDSVSSPIFADGGYFLGP